MTRWSEEQFNEWAKKKRRESLVPVATESKYHNIPTEVDGIRFDSKRESRRYLELKSMEKAGLINDLELQKRFELIPPYELNGKKIRAITYVADFYYFDQEKSEWVIEDVKSKATTTDVYKIKKKLVGYILGKEINEIYD